MSIVKLLQISDPHLLAEPGRTMLGVDTSQSLQCCLEHAIAHHGPFDLILLSGDLAQDPSPATYRRLNQLLQTLATPCLCLPGNHDALEVMRAELHGDNINCDQQRDLGNWRLIALNSQKPNSPVGRLAESEFMLLERQLTEQANRPTVVIMHHPCVDCGTPWLDPMKIENSDRLLATLKRFPQVKLLLCGHIHQEFAAPLQHATLLTAPSTCFQFTPGALEFSLDTLAPGYRIVELFEDGGWQSQCERIAEGLFSLDLSAHGY